MTDQILPPLLGPHFKEARTDIPKFLLENMTLADLDLLHKRFKRTRRRFFEFSLNGRTQWTTRRVALDMVKAELQRRT